MLRQILSGDRLFIIDPTGIVKHEITSKAGSRRSRHDGTALGYKFVGSNLMASFPNTFAPFEALPFGFTGEMFNGVIIR